MIITGILSAIALFLVAQIVAHIVSILITWVKGFYNHGSEYYHMVQVERIKTLNSQGCFVQRQVSRYGIPVPSNFRGLEDELKL